MSPNQPAALLTQCAAVQCAPGSLGDHPLPIQSDSIIILAAIDGPEPWRQRRDKEDGQPAVELWTQSAAVCGGSLVEAAANVSTAKLR